MSFRRLPFQFTATNPADRQSELMRRFGVPTDGEMLVETPNSHIVDAFGRPTSPRLQHRLPQFVTEGRAPTEKESCAQNVDSGKSPRVRVIPIQVESGSGERRNRQRTRSGGSVQNCHLATEDRVRSSSNSSLPVSPEPVKHSLGSEGQVSTSPTVERSSKPRVFNIPVKVEGRDDKVSKPKKQKADDVTIPVEKDARSAPKGKCNGPCLTKSPSKAKAKEQEQKPSADVSLKQIEDVLKEVELYKEGVNAFTGSSSDKEYRYLDEMLTRCMLKLDVVETFGNEEVRKARKAAIKQVEQCLGLLESKVVKEAGKTEDVMTEDLTVNEKELPGGAAGETVHADAEMDEEQNRIQVDTPAVGSVSKKEDATTDRMEVNEEMSTQVSTSEDICAESSEKEAGLCEAAVTAENTQEVAAFGAESCKMEVDEKPEDAKEHEETRPEVADDAVGNGKEHEESATAEGKSEHDLSGDCTMVVEAGHPEEPASSDIVQGDSSEGGTMEVEANEHTVSCEKPDCDVQSGSVPKSSELDENRTEGCSQPDAVDGHCEQESANSCVRNHI